MAKIVKQYRFYGNGNIKNYPATKFEDMFNQNVSSGSIMSLRIQSLPGVKFFFNYNEKELFTIGQTGIYELEELNGLGNITSLNFTSESIELINTGLGYIIINVIYDEIEEEE